MDEAPNLNNLCMWRQDDFGEISDNFCWYQNSGFNFNFFSLREGIGYNYLEWRSHIYGWLNKDFIQFCMYHPNISNFIHCYDFWGDIYGCFILFLILELFDLEIIGSKCFQVQPVTCWCVRFSFLNLRSPYLLIWDCFSTLRQLQL